MCLVLGCLAASAALAQGTSVISGIVTDAATGKPVADVVVSARSPALQGEQVVVTDAAGLYRLSQLPAGEYSLRLERESYRAFSRGEIALRLDRTVRLNVQLQPEALQSETIVITARPPTVDVGNTTQGLNVGADFINNIAFIRPTGSGVRSFESLVAVAPQVSGDAYGYGFSGAQSPENLYLLDGVSVNNAAYGTNSGTLPVDFIQEANVITGAYQAEYGRAGGGVLNAITKSGSNEFHGSVFANYTPGLLSPNSPPVPQVGAAVVTSTKVWNVVDFGADLGGPIVKDRLWFYVGISPSWSRVARQQYLNRLELTDEEGNVLAPAIEHVPGSDRQQFDDRRSLSFIAKLTYLANSENTLTLAASGNYAERHQPTFHDLWVGGSFPASTTSLSLKYAGRFLDQHLLVDAAVGWFHETQAFLPEDGTTIGSTTGAAALPVIELANPDLRITDYERYPEAVRAACNPVDPRAPGETLNGCPLTGQGRYAIGGFGGMQVNTNDRLTARASVAYLVQAAGHHIIKGGLDLDRTTYGITKAISGGTWTRQSASGATYNDFRQYAYLTGPDQLTAQKVITLAPATNQLGVFVQDSWSILDVVTLNAGLRYDNQVLFDGAGNVGLALKNELSPRVGLIYDFTNQGRSKLFASYGRYFESIPLDLADRALSGEYWAGYNHRVSCAANPPNITPQDLLSAACNGPAAYAFNGSFTNPSRFALVTGSGKTAIDPAIEPASKDELVVGAEYEVISDLRLGVTYTKSWVNKVIEDMSNDEASTYFLGNPGYGLASSATSGFPKAVRDYDAVTVTASRAFSNGWMAQVSYTWSYLRGNWSGFYSPEYQNQLDPGITADFDLKSLLANRTGPLGNDRTHFIKAYGAKEFVLAGSLSLLLGLTYEGSSGTPVNYLGSHPIYGDGESFLLPRGSAGRLPWTHVINLKAGVGYRFDKDLGVQVSVDALNLFNFAGVTNVDSNYTFAAALPYTGNAPDALCQSGVSGCTPKNLVLDGDTGEVRPMRIEEVNQNFKKPATNLPLNAYQPPMQWRFSAKFSF